MNKSELGLKPWRGALVFITAAALLLVGCDKPTNTREGKTEALPIDRSLRFAQLPISYSAVTFIAETNGYYKTDALDYRSFSVPAGPDVVTALKGTGPAAADCGGIAVTPVVTMIGAGDEPVVIATTLVSDYQAKLITFSESGIAEDPATLKGKKIGVVKNTNGDVYLSRLLKKGGLTATNVVLVNGRPADLRNLLVRGDVDAAVIWDPFTVQVKREYTRQLAEHKVRPRGEVVVFVDPKLHTLAFNVVTTRSKLESKKSELTEMLRGTIKGGEFIAKDPKDAQRLLESWLGLESGDLDDLMATTTFRVELNVPKMKEWLRQELDWLRETRPDTRIPDDLSRFVEPSLLKSIDAKRVVE